MNVVPGILHRQRHVALAVITVLVIGASGASFAESYRGLYLWAHHHGLSGIWAAAWPLQVDTFIGVGELALFVALVDQWKPRARASAWAVTLAGLAVSVAGNIGHVASHAVTARGTAAIPPLAAAAALAVGLGVLKRVVDKHHRATAKPEPKTTLMATVQHRRKASSRGPAAASRAAIEAASQGQPVPSARQLARDHHIGREKAGQIRSSALAEANGHGGQPGQLAST
jgi:hypothetical protein